MSLCCREKEKTELKARITELEDYKDKYEHEQRENQVYTVV